MVNKEFHSAFATIAITILSIMLAFYGIVVITLAQQAQIATQNAQTYSEKAQASKANAANYLRQTDDVIRTFAYTIEPPLGSSNNWSISMEQDYNVQRMLSPYWKTNTSFLVMSTLAVNSLLGNYSEAVREDEAVREWLNSLNITRFKASYNLAEFSLHDIVSMLYTQFPPTPARRNESQAVIFIDSDSSDPTSFLTWLEEYRVFYNDVSIVHSRINDSVEGISQAYSDGAKLISEELDELQKENSNNSWAIQSLGEIMTYDGAMSTYYPSVFDSLDAAFSCATGAEVCINQYGGYVNQSESYLKQYDAIYNLAFSNIFSDVVQMAVSGVIIPMSLLGLANWYQSKLDNRIRWRVYYRHVYYAIIIASVLWFGIATVFSMNVLWTQISRLFLS